MDVNSFADQFYVTSVLKNNSHLCHNKSCVNTLYCVCITLQIAEIHNHYIGSGNCPMLQEQIL